MFFKIFFFFGFWVIFGRKTGASVRDGVDRSTPFSCIFELFFNFLPQALLLLTNSELLKFYGNYAEFLFCKVILSYGKLLFKAKFNEFLQGLIVFLNVP